MSSNKRVSRPSAKLKDANNTGEIELSAHQSARDRAIAADSQASKISHDLSNAPTLPAGTNSSGPSSASPSAPPASSYVASNSAFSSPAPDSTQPDEPHHLTTSNLAITRDAQQKEPIELSDDEDTQPCSTAARKRLIVASSDDNAAATASPAKKRKTRKKGKKKARSPSPDAETSESEPEIKKAPLKQRSRDCDPFFEKPFTTRVAGVKKVVRKCIDCSKGGAEKLLVSDVSTLRRHIASAHEAKYNSWCKRNNFQSMLPQAVLERKEAALAAIQTTLDDHVQQRDRTQPNDQAQPAIVYTEKAFREAALEWLIATDQPIQALEHPRFKRMMQQAFAAPKSTANNMPLLDRRATRRHIIMMFKTNMNSLRERLKSNKMGLISMTCDAWQASNADAYFAVTGHWNEYSRAEGTMKRHSALFGFVPMNSSHDGKTMGRALYGVVKRLGFGNKVGWITCDNATNNLTMLQYFARYLNRSKMRRDCKKVWDPSESHIQCLAHVINLATQAVLSTYSQTEFYDPSNVDGHEPDVDADERDEVGLVRAITVKARSSAKRKDILEKLQIDAGNLAVTLLLDMKVRWSSTLVMLERAVKLRLYIQDFLVEIMKGETDTKKRAKIDALRPTEDEWKRIEKLITLLQFADTAQHAFSYENSPVLHTALPALEALHQAWKKRVDLSKYRPFEQALQAGMEKIESYYDKTASSHAYTFAMLLDPDTKMGHFQKHWDADLQADILKHAERIFKERYFEMHEGDTPAPAQPPKKTNERLARLMAEYTSDESDKEEPTPAQRRAQLPSTPPIAATPSVSTDKPWLHEFNMYINGTDTLDIAVVGGPTNKVETQKMAIIDWWGANAARLPVWGSLARDYLAIMASSVSSERAFSSAGITITKRRNRLNADIVEALQFMKCLLKTDLLYSPPAPSTQLEAELEILDEDRDEDWVDEVDPKSWDSLVIDIDTDADT